MVNDDKKMNSNKKNGRGKGKKSLNNETPKYSNLVLEEVEVTKFLRQESHKTKTFSNLILEEVEVTEFVE